MAQLLSGLKADDSEVFNEAFGHKHKSSSDEDEDASRFVERRKSMNEFNEVGRNFQKYQDNKPAKGVTNEILNMFNEYKDSNDREHAKDEFIEEGEEEVPERDSPSM